MATAAELADTFTAAAEENYLRDGHLVPTLILLNPRRHVFVTLAATDDVPDLAARCLMAMCGVVRPSHAVLIAETWRKVFEQEQDVSQFPHGALEQMEASGDATVLTGLMVTVFDCKHRNRSHLNLTIDHGDHFTHELSEAGPGEGRLPELFEAAYSQGMVTEPPTFDIAQIGEYLGQVGWITSMMVEEQD